MSRQLFESLLKALKKANNSRKMVLAGRAGYDSVEAYQKFLEGSITTSVETETVKEKPAKKEKVRPEVIEEVKEESELTDLVIAFDTTGSMGSYIANVKRHLSSLIPNLFAQNPNLKISVVAFGDYCDMHSATDFGRAYQVLELTNNQDVLVSFVKNASNTGGGDSAEFYELVIRKINTETAWREGSNKSVLFIADDVPHELGYSYSDRIQNNDIDWRKEANVAKSMGIVYDTLKINKRNTWYEELSQITDGVSLDFQSSSKTNQLVEATALARGGKATQDAFFAKSMSAEVASDSELTSVYAMYKTIIK